MPETPQQYTQRIFGFVNGKGSLDAQGETAETLARLIQSLGREQLSRHPEPSKWSITEILAHLVDAEIVVSWRMRIMIGQSSIPIPAVDQHAWAQTFDYQRHDSQISLETFRVLRENNLRMLRALPQHLWENYGIHSERGKETLADIVRMYAGHDLNHLAQVEKIAQVSGG